jgi:uncharacterized protein YndB with AHSA1/START domain
MSKHKPNAIGTIKIAAPAEKVYDLVSDPGSLADFAAEYCGYEWLDGATAPEVGARFKGKNRRGFARWNGVATITAADPGRRYAFKVAVAGFTSAVWQYEIEPKDDGCLVTESTWRLVPKPISGTVGTLIGAPNRDAVNQEHIDATLRQLKAVAEGDG